MLRIIIIIIICSLNLVAQDTLKYDKLPNRSVNTNKKNKTTSEQCQGITKKGTQCSRKASNGGYCYQHNHNTSTQIKDTKDNKEVNKTTSEQCQGITKKGTQCSRKASNGGYCYQHK